MCIGNDALNPHFAVSRFVSLIVGISHHTNASGGLLDRHHDGLLNRPAYSVAAHTYKLLVVGLVGSRCW